MHTTTKNVGYSVLGLATIIDGKTAAGSFKNSLAIAQLAEQSGLCTFLAGRTS
jgi:hypothetical protein